MVVTAHPLRVKFEFCLLGEVEISFYAGPVLIMKLPGVKNKFVRVGISILPPGVI
jgi:hypothetical protein